MPIDWDSQPLGKFPDKDLAEVLGVAEGEVKEQRVMRGIPAEVTSLLAESALSKALHQAGGDVQTIHRALWNDMNKSMSGHHREILLAMAKKIST